MVSREEFKETVGRMIRLATTRLPQDVMKALRAAREREGDPTAKSQLEAILRNLKIAREEGVPICQDTGIPIFFIKIGPETDLDFRLEDTLQESVRRATKEVPLRPNVVDPLTRENSGDNTGRGHPIVHTRVQAGEGLEVKLMLKGGGSENWSRLFMLSPIAWEDDIRGRIIRVVEEAGGQICPPTIIGVGIGGTADEASLLAKRALLRPLDEEGEDGELAGLEGEITESANELGIGPMGLGGGTTVLGTKIESAGCHTASLPVALNFHCWAARRAEARTRDGELQIEVPG